MNNGVSYTSTKPIDEFEINKKNKPSDLISRLSELRSQYSCFEETERDAYHTLSEAIGALQAQKTGKWMREVLGSTSGYGTTIMYQCTNCEKMSISKYNSSLLSP